MGPRPPIPLISIIHAAVSPSPLQWVMSDKQLQYLYQFQPPLFQNPGSNPAWLVPHYVTTGWCVCVCEEKTKT